MLSWYLDCWPETFRLIMNAIIMAAGTSNRWARYLGVPKQLVRIAGETLLDRLIRQLQLRGISSIYLTVPKLDFFRYPDENALRNSVPQIVGFSDLEIDKYLNGFTVFTEPTLYVGGDIYFTDPAMDAIVSNSDPLRFFGRRNRSRFTGKQWGELFAAKVNQEFMRQALDLRKAADRMQPCDDWQQSKVVFGHHFEKSFGNGCFTEIDDFTDDFDFPDDFERWMARFRAAQHPITDHHMEYQGNPHS
jgi:MobA-like NTP transferase domain